MVILVITTLAKASHVALPSAMWTQQVPGRGGRGLPDWRLLLSVPLAFPFLIDGNGYKISNTVGGNTTYVKHSLSGLDLPLPCAFPGIIVGPTGDSWKGRFSFIGTPQKL
jgi:hypothetical protein